MKLSFWFDSWFWNFLFTYENIWQFLFSCVCIHSTVEISKPGSKHPGYIIYWLKKKNAKPITYLYSYIFIIIRSVMLGGWWILSQFILCFYIKKMVNNSSRSLFPSFKWKKAKNWCCTLYFFVFELHPLIQIFWFFVLLFSYK